MPSSSADDAGEELVAAACAATTYSNCVKTMSAALDIFAGKLVVVCEYGDGQGGVLAIERREDAEGACSPGVSTTETPPPGSSSVPPGRVVTVVQLP